MNRHELVEHVARIIEPDAWRQTVWNIWPPRGVLQDRAREKAQRIVDRVLVWRMTDALQGVSDATGAWLASVAKKEDSK